MGGLITGDMAKLGTNQKPTLNEISLVIDVDTHVQETLDMIIENTDDRHVEFREFVKNSPKPLAEIFPKPNPQSPPYLYEHMKEEVGKDTRFISDEKTGFETSKMAGELKIDYGIVSTSRNLGHQAVRNERLAAGMVNGFNNWLVKDLDAYENLFGNMLVSYGADPHEMAEEIDRMANENSIVGIQWPAHGITPPPGHSKYNPIFEAAQDHNLPISMHSANGYKPYPLQFRWAKTFAEDHVFQHPATHIWNITSLIMRGVPQRFPDLEFVFQEAGIGYVPYLLERLDQSYQKFGYEISDIEKPPSEIIADRFYWGTQPLGHTALNPQHISWLIEMIGPSQVMFASDIPHPDFDTPEELFDRIVTHFDFKTVRNIMGRNAKQLYDL